jgi:raffinose/stachyose/melibiose transport system substrate-binding protein
MALALPGCQPQSPAQKSSELVIYQPDPARAPAWEAVGQRFMEANSHITLRFAPDPGGAPDSAGSLALLADPTEAQLANGADLTGTAAANAALPGATLNLEGQVRALPLGLDRQGFIYNKDMMERAEVDPATVTTLEALGALLAVMDERKFVLPAEQPMAFAAAENREIGLVLANTFLAEAFAGGVPGDLTFNDGAFKTFVDLLQQYAEQPAFMIDRATQVDEFFKRMFVAMIFQDSACYYRLRELSPEFAENVGMLPFFVSAGDAEPVDIPAYWVVNSQDAGAESAKVFLDWLYTNEAGMAAFADLGLVPAYNGFDAALLNPLAQVVYGSVQGRRVACVYRGFPPGWGEEVLAENVKQYLAGTQSWAGAMQEAKAQWAGGQ